MKSYSKITKPTDPGNVHKRMGLFYLGKKNQMNHKKTLYDSHCITREDGAVECKSITRWIEDDLITIWNDSYSKGGSKRLQLCSDALKELWNKMEEVYPAIYADYMKRKAERMAARKLMKHFS
jgi:hypothetical protein